MKIEVKSVPHRKVPVSDILPNPHRDLKTNPTQPEKIDALIDSIERNGFWDNIVVREHPTKDGKFELAYGHNRLAALKSNKIVVDTITIPVAKLSDWEMYVAMVDENETQATITPGIVMENVGVGASLIEQYVKASDTAAEFLANFGATFAGARSSFLTKANGYGMVKARVERGEGPGGDVVMALIPSARLHKQVVSTVLGSIYGRAKEASKRKQAEAKDAEAEAKRTKAAAEKNTERAAKLRKEAEEADAEARKLEREAAKLAKDDIRPDILLMMPSAQHMAEFASQVRRLSIPQDKHLALAKLIDKEEWSKRDVRTKTAAWWDMQSGAYAKRMRDAEVQKRRVRLEKMIEGGDLGSFLVKLDAKVCDLERTLKIASEAAEFASPKMKAAIAKNWPRIAGYIEDIIAKARGRDAELVDVTPGKPKMLMHQGAN